MPYLQGIIRFELEQIPKDHAADHLVRHDKRTTCALVGDLLEGCLSTNVGIRIAFAAWEAPSVQILVSAGKFAPMGALDLLVRQTRHLTVVDLVKLVDEHHLENYTSGKDSCRRGCPAQGARNPSIDRQAGHHGGKPVVLGYSLRGKWGIQPALATTSAVPIGLRMTDEKHLRERQV